MGKWQRVRSTIKRRTKGQNAAKSSPARVFLEGGKVESEYGER